MAQRKSKSQNKEAGAFKADHSNVRPEDDTKDLAAEERKAFMQRRSGEEKELKNRRKVVNYHYEIVGGRKVIKKTLKANGAVYSEYVGNCEKNPEILKHPDVVEHLKK